MQDFYKGILDEMNTAYALFEVIYGPDGPPVDYLVVETNSAWEKLLRVKGEDIFGKLLSEFHRPEAFVKAKRLCDKAVVSRKKEVVDIYLERFKMWYRTELIPKMHYLAVLVSDVTDFKNLEMMTHDNERTMAVHKQLFNGMLDARDDGVCLIGQGMNLLARNVEFDRMFPYVTPENFAERLGVDLTSCLQDTDGKQNAVWDMMHEGTCYEVRRNAMQGKADEKMCMCFFKKRRK